MRRTAAILCACAVALGAPSALAGGKKTKYAGAFEPTGALTFVVKKANDGKKVFNFKWTEFPLDCEGTPETSSSHLNFSVDVKHGKFDARAVDNADNPGALLKLKGELNGKIAAQGTMVLEGKKVPVDSGGREKCDSGKVPWAAASAG